MHQLVGLGDAKNKRWASNDASLTIGRNENAVAAEVNHESCLGLSTVSVEPNCSSSCSCTGNSGNFALEPINLRHDLGRCFFTPVSQVTLLNALLNQLEKTNVIFVSSELDALSTVEETGSLCSLSKGNIVSFTIELPEVSCSACKAASRSFIDY